MADLNLDGLPELQAFVDFDREQFDYSVSSERRTEELCRLVERERAAVAEDCDACQKNNSLWWDSTLPAWAKPVMLELRKLVKAL